MKIAIIGAAGVRTPLILQAIFHRQDRLGISELAMMDIDGDRLELISAITSTTEQTPQIKFKIIRTTDPSIALQDANFVITTFRVGGMESRVIDEKVPLRYGLLGQETTGAGGFAMGIRSIPVLLDYVEQMERVCPEAWLINFANPAGMLTEAVIRNTDWRRIIGICDGPSSIQMVIAALMKVKPDDIYLNYFGLNHLGWIDQIRCNNRDILPELLQFIQSTGNVPGLPFDADFITSLSMLPNEYLYYYYYAHQAVKNIAGAGESRGEQIVKLNLRLLDDLRNKYTAHDIQGMQETYEAYLSERGNTYMVKETGKTHDLSSLGMDFAEPQFDEGYAGVALNLIEGLIGNRQSVQILNVPNNGSIDGMEELDVVEIPTIISRDNVVPMSIGKIPNHCYGLIKQVKYYERLTIDAAVKKSFQKARLALTVHPLVRDFSLATQVLDEYMTQHRGYFPELH